MVPESGPLKRDPLCISYIPYPSQGSILQNPLKEVRDHVQGPM